MIERFKKQIAFIVEIDKIKSILRKTKLFDHSRYENDSEHSWHLAVMAVILSEDSNTPVDPLKVMKMVLVHDIVEIDAGDVLVYSKDEKDTSTKEDKAAKRIFGLLPDDQRDELSGLWREFEEKKTPESKFAFAIDRLEPVMQNFFNDAQAWKENNVPAEKVLEVNEKIHHGSERLWSYAKSLIEECIGKGFIR
jgi:putative hydrolases of HD superfamily